MGVPSAARILLTLAWAAASTLALPLAARGETSKRAGAPNVASSRGVVESTGRQGSWWVVETRSFQICSDAADATAATRMAVEAEGLRRDLVSRWLGAAAADRGWNPKCQIVMHGTVPSYVQAVGPGSDRTQGSSEVLSDRGQIMRRRIDLNLKSGGDPLANALPHELTHVVWKDRFPNVETPRWAEEGVALLADPHAKRERHLGELRTAVNHESTFEMAALLSMQDYPPLDRWGVFYGQSLSLTQFLVERKSPEHFLTFVERAAETGYDAALRECYGLEGISHLNAQWRRGLKTSYASAVVDR